MLLPPPIHPWYCWTVIFVKCKHAILLLKLFSDFSLLSNPLFIAAWRGVECDWYTYSAPLLFPITSLGFFSPFRRFTGSSSIKFLLQVTLPTLCSLTLCTSCSCNSDLFSCLSFLNPASKQELKSKWINVTPLIIGIIQTQMPHFQDLDTGKWFLSPHSESL